LWALTKIKAYFVALQQYATCMNVHQTNSGRGARARYGAERILRPFGLTSSNTIRWFVVNHRVISRAMRHCLSNLVFERLLPPFKIRNVIWFWHVARLMSGRGS
jgi:hypothetical protein